MFGSLLTRPRRTARHLGSGFAGWRFGVVAFGAALMLSACAKDGGSGSDADGKECKTGDEGCACYPNKTCNDDLSCYSKLCVREEASEDEDSKPSKDDESESDASADDADDADDSTPSNTSNDPDEPADPDDPKDPDNTEPDDPDSTDPDTTDPDDPDPSTTEPDDTDPGPSVAPEDTPVGIHGQLHVQGTKLTDEHGNPTQLKGMSSMWLNWEPTGYAESLEGLRWMRDNWRLQIIRAAMGVAEQPGDGAYLEDKEKAKRQVRTIVENAIELGVYVLIDWHDHHALDNEAEAIAFFTEMAQEYAGVPNVLYELFNEPLDVDWGTQLRPYHTNVSAAIRAHDTNNVIVMGTPNWSQDVDVAALNPVEGTNLMYTLHFYACDHTANVRAKGVTALANGLPLFVTEWGATPADGGVEEPIVCEAEAQAWHDWMDSESISWAAWKLDGCADTTCIFKNRNVPVDGGWTEDMLNGHAPFVIARMKSVPTPVEPDPMMPPDNGCVGTGSCSNADRMECDADGNLVEGDCSACALLSCASCCGSIGYFGAIDTQGTFTIDQSVITGFSQSASSVVLETSFSAAYEAGAIAFSLDAATAINPDSVAVDLVATGGDAYVTLENGSSGCLYPLIDLGGTIGLDTFYSNCWGSALPGDPVLQINIRIDSLSSGAGQLTFYGISW